MTELHELTAVELGRAVASGDVSPVEVTEHFLDRISSYDSRLGAFVTVTADLALSQAKEQEALARDGALASPLAGVPVPVKDLNHVAGVPVSYGSAAYAGTIAPVDDHVVRRMKAAGTICLGKTSTPEFGLPCYTETAIGPPARTPWDLSRGAGGSSGGAAAAVAGGLAPLAQGSDGGGSIRIPASCCGLFGLKPSRGRVSSGPLFGDVGPGLGVIGPIAWTVADAAALLDVMAGPELGDPHWAPPLPTGETFAEHARRDPGRLRIARFRTPVVGATELHPQCVVAYEGASRLLETLGHEVVDVEAPIPPDVVPSFEVVWSVLATLTPVPDGNEETLRPLTRYLRGRGAPISGTTFAQAIGAMQAVTRAAVSALAPYDAVLTPTLADLPAAVGALRNDDDPFADFEAQKRFTPFTALWNVTGMPAVSLPLHHTEPLDGAPEGLPVGVMLAGRPAGEAALLSLAAQVESAAPWRSRRATAWQHGPST
ncbi:MAG: amidase [Actinomycetales bacterium]